MAPSAKKAFKAFVDDLPNDKLTGFPNQPHTLHKDNNFRLDMQGCTKTAWNLQIQANREAHITSVRKVAPNSLATVLVAFESTATADEIKEAFNTSFENKTSEKI